MTGPGERCFVKVLLKLFRICLPALLGPIAAWATYPTVQANNLTHPNLSPSFIAGDSYQYVILGDPNQPVYIVQNDSPLTLVGQTDGNGYYQTTGVEQAAWVGNYTQTWYVSSTQALPSL